MISAGVMISFFVIAMILFSANFANDNDSQVSILNDSRYSDLNSSLQGDVSGYETDSNTSSNILFKTVLEAGDEHSSSGGQFKVGPISALGLATTSFTTSFKAIFGDEFWFILTGTIALLTSLLGYFTIKAWLGRDPS